MKLPKGFKAPKDAVKKLRTDELASYLHGYNLMKYSKKECKEIAARLKEKQK
jgi:hypothetical protein